jgi:hypothetical protein
VLREPSNDGILYSGEALYAGPDMRSRLIIKVAIDIGASLQTPGFAAARR